MTHKVIQSTVEPNARRKFDIELRQKSKSQESAMTILIHQKTWFEVFRNWHARRFCLDRISTGLETWTRAGLYSRSQSYI